MNPARFLALILPFAASGVSAQNVSILSYSYLSEPTLADHDFADPTKKPKLTDETAIVPAWGGTDFSGDPSAFVGWQSAPAEITFNFSDNTLIDSATFYLADSDNLGGVNLPYQIELYTDDYSFDEYFSVSNPSGTGSAVPITLSGFQVTTNRLNVLISTTAEWTMMSEVTFTGTTVSAIPEPSTYAALAGALALGVVVWRRRVTAIAKR